MPALIAILMAFAATVQPTSAAAQTVCPGANAQARQALVSFLTSESTLPTRQKDGWANVSALNLRLLTDATDSAVCAKLRDGIRLPQRAGTLQWAFFYAHGFYFVSTVKVHPAGSLVLGHNPLIVLRSDLSLVDSYSN